MSGRRTTSQAFFNAKQLRREMTSAENKLWLVLKAHKIEGIHFRRQHPIGKYITDFCAPSQKLVVELDGSTHNEQKEYDLERTNFLISKGYRVLRFWNRDIEDRIDWVKQRIVEALDTAVPRN